MAPRFLSLSLTCSALWLLAAPANAATSGASASAFVSGSTVNDAKSGDATGVQTSAAQTVPSPAGDVFVSAQAHSNSASLGLAGVARSMGAPGGFQAQATATWNDNFTILAPNVPAGATGTFSGSVQVSGDLSFSLVGRSYADTLVGAAVDIFPGTGFNGGRTLITGGARRFGGYDIADGGYGTEGFSLVFDKVPFTFGQPINLNMSMTLSAGIDILNAGSSGQAQADYSHTLSWAGLSEVRGADGQAVSGYSAPSQSFDFNYAPVPEPSAPLSLMAGLAVLAGASKFRRRPA